MESVYAPDDNGTYVFGGQTATGFSNELWRIGAAATTPNVTSVVNAFSYAGGGVAPGELVSVFGANLGPATGIATSFDSASGKLPTGAGGVSVTFNGVAAPLYYVRADQVNAQVPYEVAGAQQLQIAVTAAAGVTPPLTLALRATHPGLAPVVFNEDITLNSAGNPAAAGSIVVLFATGQGVTSPASTTGTYPRGTYPAPLATMTLTIGGKPATVLFQGQAPFTAGVMQINARLPDGLVGPVQPIVLQIGESVTQQAINVYLK
jgi:uncharacterized protein (TIGR03437 family)